jgi:hypothetical protein
MATRVANPPANSPYKGPVIQVDTGAGYTVDVNDQTVAVVLGGAGSTVTLPQNPQADVTQINFIAESAFNLTAGALGGLTPAFGADPDAIAAGDNFTVAFNKAGKWVKINDAGGASGGGNPLVRTKWIDGDTTTAAANANGTPGLPFASVSAYFTALGPNATASDANQTAEALISPATAAAYTESPNVPAYRNIILRLIASGLSGVASFAMTGSLVWANTAAAGGVHVGAIGSLGLANWSISGNLTYTDDGGAPASELLISHDQAPSVSMIGGNILASTATTLVGIVLLNASVVGNITSTASGTGAALTMVQGGCNGAITAKTGSFTDCTFSGGGANIFTFAAGSTPSFIGCIFSGGSIAASAGTVVTMDAGSWASFQLNGMTVGAGVTIKLLTGNPPSRVRYIDGGALATNTPTGDIEAPFVSVSAAIAAVGVPLSAGDANQTMLLKLCPSTVAAYTENPAFKAYRNYKLIGDGSIGQIGNTITGNVSWANVAGGGAVIGTSASLSLRDVSITGTLTLTDDATMAGVTEQVTISASEQAGDTLSTQSPTAGVAGTTTMTGVTHATLDFYVVNATMGNLVSSASATGAVIQLSGAFVGSVTCNQLVASRTKFASSTITVNSGAPIKLIQCSFSGSAPVLVAGATGTITMDGSTWAAFLEAGGTITSGIVLVIGGSQAGLVRTPPTAAAGASTSIGDASVSISLNGQAAGTTAGFTGGGNLYEEKTTLTAGRTVTVKTGGGELTGDTIDIVRSGPSGALGAFTLTVNNNAGNPQAVIAASQRGWVRVQFNTTIANDWGVIAVGGGVT